MSDTEEVRQKEIERENDEFSAEQIQETEQEVEDPKGTAPLDEDNEDLSDVDEAQFNDEPLDEEEVSQLSAHRRKTPAQTETSEPKERKRRVRRPIPEPSSPVSEPKEPIDPVKQQRQELEARIDAALRPSSKRRKRATGDDLDKMQDDMISDLRRRMRFAAVSDAEAVTEGKPALAKVKMLPEVSRVLGQSSLVDSILDGNLLESLRVWLEPLPDASLPSYEIQKELFDALLQFPIKTIHLRESGLGKVMMFYQKSRRPHPSIKRAAEKLIGDWTRPIMGRSDNYRDRHVATAVFDPDQALSGSARTPITSTSSQTRMTAAEEAATRRGRAAIPSSNRTTYSVAPMNITAGNTAGARPSSDSQLRRMKTKLMQSQSGRSKKSQVSIEGRGL